MLLRCFVRENLNFEVSFHNDLNQSIALLRMHCLNLIIYNLFLIKRVLIKQLANEQGNNLASTKSREHMSTRAHEQRFNLSLIARVIFLT